MVLFRKTVELDAAVTAATFYLTADGFFTLYVNGTLVTSNTSWDDPRAVDATRLLHEGSNVVVVRVDRKRADNGFIFNGFVQLASGRQIAIKSDESWQTSSTLSTDWTGLDPANETWQHAIFHAQIDDFGWPNTAAGIHFHTPPPPQPHPIAATGTDEKVTRLLGERYRLLIAENLNPSQVEPKSYLLCDRFPAKLDDFARCAKHMYRAGTDVDNSLGGKSLIFDFGRDTFGRISLQFSTAPGRSESLNVISGEDRAQLLFPQFQESYTYSLPPSPQMENIYRAARYVAVRLGSDMPKGNLRIAFKPQGYPVVNKGYFESSDPALNTIWQTALHTLRVNMQGYYWDGIRRDRALWVGDLLEEARTNYYTFGDLELVKKSLFNLSLYRGEHGQVRAQLGIGNADWYLTDYVAKYVSAMADYYRFSGDAAFIGDMKPTVAAQLDYLQSLEDSAGLVVVKYDPSFTNTDWSSSNRYGTSTYQQDVYYKALQDGAFLMTALGDRALSRTYALRAAHLRTATIAQLFDPSLGVFHDVRLDGTTTPRVTEDSNVLAVEYGLVNGSPAKRVLSYLWSHLGTPFGARLIDKPYNGELAHVEMNNSISPMMNTYQASAMIDQGETASAFNLIKRAYRDMGEDSGTFWEFRTLDGFHQSTWSLAHGWSSNVAAFLSSSVLGIAPLQPSFSRFALAPHLLGLRWVKGAVPTPHGLIGATIAADANGFVTELSLISPHGTTAELSLPISSQQKTMCIDGYTVASDRNNGSTFRTTLAGGTMHHVRAAAVAACRNRTVRS